MNLEKAAKMTFYLLLASAPLSTRYIGYMGNIGGVDIEAGTVSMFGTQLLAIIFVILTLTVAVERKGGMTDWKKDPFSFAALFIVVSAYISAALSFRFTSSLVVASWVALGAAVFGSARIIRPSTLYSAAAIMAGAVVQAVFAAVQFATQEVVANKWIGVAAHLPSEAGSFVVDTGDGRWLRAYGTLPHPNELGLFLAVAALVALAFAAGREGWSRRLATVAAVGAVFGMVLTFSRGAAVGFLVGLIALAVPTFAGTGRRKPRLSPTLSAVTIGLIALVAGTVALSEPVLTRVTAEGRLERISIQERSSQLADAGMLLKDNPVFGVGPGMMPYAVHSVDSERNPWDYQYVHSSPLLVMVETGVLGAAVWAFFIWILASVALRTIRREAAPDWIPFLPALAVFVVAGLVDHFVWTSWFGQLMFWCVAALAVTAAAPLPRMKKEGGRLVVE